MTDKDALLSRRLLSVSCLFMFLGLHMLTWPGGTQYNLTSAIETFPVMILYVLGTRK